MEDTISNIIFWCTGKVTIRLLCASKSFHNAVSQVVLIQSKVRRLLLKYATYDQALLAYVHSKRPNVKTVQYLTQRSTTDSRNEALFKVCERGHTYLCEALVGCNVSLDLDRALLHCRYNDFVTRKTLLDAGADIHVQNDILLRHGCANRFYDWCEYLLDRGADVHANFEECLKTVCVGYGTSRLCKLLLDKGAVPNVEGLVLASSLGKAEICKLLLAKGVDVHANRDAALRGALSSGYSYICCILLNAGANIDVVHQYNNRELVNRVLRDWSNYRRNQNSTGSY